MRSRQTSLSFVLLMAGWLLLAVLALLTALPIGAQATARPTTVGAVHAVDSTARRCLDIGWLAPSSTCEGRAQNAAALAVLGAGSGALAGFVGGALAPTSCLGGGEKNAVRGAIAGAAIGTVAGLLVRHVSRRDRAARSARGPRDGGTPPRAWSWRDVRPAVVALGGVAATGALIGGVQGSRAATPCDGGVGGGLAQGGGVYALGGLSTVAGTLLAVRFLF